MISSGRDHAAAAERDVIALFAGADVLNGAVAWATGHLQAEGIDPSRHGGRAVRSLRAARPELSKHAALYLAHRAAGGGAAGDSRSPSPLLH